ncbi:MAG: selenide,water dikinase [Verrucomicrobiales bacterium]
MRFDTASINIGSTPNMATIPGADQWATPSKPVPAMLERWASIVAAHENGQTPKDLVIVGAGAGGVELALGMHERLGRKPLVHLVHRGGEILTTHNPKVRARFQRLLDDRGIQVHLNEDVVKVEENAVVCASGKVLSSGATFWVTQASPATWPKEAGLKVDDAGFVLVSETLQSISHPHVFAAGDVATMKAHPRPKSGVFAVRQGAPLFDNLGATARGEELRPYRPQREFLSLIGTATASAVASRRWLAWESPLMWKLKDWIDRKFMRKFEDFPDMEAAGETVVVPRDNVRENDALADLKRRAEMRCLGCAAKVGSGILRRTLQRIRQETSGRGAEALSQLSDSDDAAVFSVPLGEQLVQTVDYMPALVRDPYQFGQITAIHSLSDLFAMGARPHGVLVLAEIPFAKDAVVEENLFQMLSGVIEVLSRHGAYLLGGHTAEGENLALGITCNGFAKPEKLLRKTNMRSGEDLILTKPIGTGTLFAAEMRLQTKSAWIDRALEHMLVDNAKAAEILAANDASACTDVTGFGLLGHLLEMTPAELAITLNMEAVATLPGARETAARGILSSIHTNNHAASEGIQNPEAFIGHPVYPLLFDPQTSGGLLGTVSPDRTEALLAALREAGYLDAAVIGRTEGRREGERAIRLT